MPIPNAELKPYAHLLIRLGVNLQPDQSLVIRTEPVHREFALLLAEEAYAAGAKFVEVEYNDPRLQSIRIRNSPEENLSHLPGYLTGQAEERRDAGWASITLVGEENPGLASQLDPNRLRLVQTAEYQALMPWRSAMMSMQLQWTGAAMPTPGWAQKVFPDASPEEALAQFWQAIRQIVRLDTDDPLTAWQAHLARLDRVKATLQAQQIRSLHFYDPTPGPDGKPATDLTVGLTDQPRWVGGAGESDSTPKFVPNIPTEEIFTTPHRLRTDGWVRTSRPSFPFRREVAEASFRFEAGELVDFSAGADQAVFEQFFAVEGTRHLGEVALVDVTSPIFRSGLVFYNTLFDENAACHIAFGRGYPVGVEGSAGMSPEELTAAGLNDSPLHLDVMIGTPTLDVTGHLADGSELAIMRQGRYTFVAQA